MIAISLFPTLAVAAELDWANIITNLGFGGFVMWFAYYTQTKTIPSILAAHGEERKQARADYLAATQQTRGDFLASITEQRVAISQLATSLDKLTTAVWQHDNDMRIAHAIDKAGIKPAGSAP